MNIELKQVSELIWEIPKSGEMLVPGWIYADKDLIKHLVDDVNRGKEWNALVQIRNVACLPGIQKASLAMADIHPGYGFAIGAIGAFDVESGIISVAGVGFDCNCGVRTLRTQLTRDDIKGKEEGLANELFRTVPAGIGSEGKIKLSVKEIDEILVMGARYAVEHGYGWQEDLTFIEEEGCVKGADPKTVSREAKERGLNQVGTLGSGNHYLEVQCVEEIFDGEAAQAFGLFKGQLLVSIHCGSRALGHQIGTDYLKTLESASRKYNIPIRERELVCAPFKSEEGQRYFRAVNCGINAAFANRQVLAHLTRRAFHSALGVDEKTIRTLYDIGHNTAKLEKHRVNGKEKSLIVHRKGATRAFGPGRPEVPSAYRNAGQPVLVGGTMGTCSYILHGTEKGMEEVFGTSVHGAGRVSSREAAKKRWRGKDLVDQLKERGIIIKGHSLSGVAEEAPGAYKDVTQVVDVVHNAGIAKKVAMSVPLISVKG
ncbi:MAG: RtcB family protein [Candidatus Omnitrophica bacterium]|nr:RtcB family protein [Candidatus Omnitrophota bacterium]MDD5737004.1 RtcB family protein [Candidatus Omnitrophota bacterium]